MSLQDLIILQDKCDELEEKLAQSQAVYNSLIDGAARDTMRINELEAELNEKVKELQLENKKLRECITLYADLDDESVGYDIGAGYARQVLKEVRLTIKMESWHE